MYESIRRGTLTMAVLKAGLNDYLDRDQDRELFDLAARQGRADGQSMAGRRRPGSRPGRADQGQAPGTLMTARRKIPAARY